jgi:hypothetical protein
MVRWQRFLMDRISNPAIMKKTILFSFCTLLSFTTLAQNFLWAEKEGDNSEGQIIATDPAGNSYVSGKLYANTTIGGQPLDISNGANFLVKYDSGGNALWIKQMDSMEVFDIACSGASVCLCGRYGTGASFNGSALPGGDSWDAFILRLDAAGNVTMQLTGQNTGYGCTNSVTLDSGGNIFATGIYYGTTMNFGTTTLSGSYGVPSMFLFKITPSGSFAWTKAITTNDGGVIGDKIRLAPSGDIYVMSTAYGDSVYYGSMYYNPGAYDAEVLVHFDNTGTAQRFQLINQSSYEVVTGLTVDASGNVYTLQNNYLMSYNLRKFNAALDSIWFVNDGTGGHLSPVNVDVLQTGQLFVSGVVSEDATFGGSVTIPNNGGQPGFIARYTNGGAFVSVKDIPGTMYMGQGALDAADNFYFTGTLSDSASFDGMPLVSGGPEAMFVAKYGVGATGTGIAENSSDELSVYPNPCSTVVNCSFKDPVRDAMVYVSDLPGRVVYREKVSGSTIQIDLSGKSKGFYFLNVQFDGQFITKKIILR